MTYPKSIHHINFIVANLEASVSKYQNLLGLGNFEFEDLPERRARTAKINLDGTWLVLVSPTQADSVPGHFLKAKGEGFFLLSFGVKDLESALDFYESNGTVPNGASLRAGLQDWQVIDLKTERALGAKFHLTNLPK